MNPQLIFIRSSRVFGTLHNVLAQYTRYLECMLDAFLNLFRRGGPLRFEPLAGLGEGGG